MYYLLSFVIGMMTAFSPCVIPLTPILVKSSTSKNKYTSIILSLGLIFSFTVFGLFVSFLKDYFNEDLIKNIAGVVLILSGILMLFPKIKELFHHHKKHSCVCHKVDSESSAHQFLLGSLLGFAWIPCSTHTFGVVMAFILMNTKSVFTFLIFTLFALGVCLPLILMSWIAKEFITKHNGKIKKISQIGNKILAYLIIIVGVMALLD